MPKITTKLHRSAATRVMALALLMLTACGQAPEQAQTVVVYEGARLIVGDGSAPIENAVFAVDSGRFVAVGEASDVSVPAGATRVDLTGMTVMPAIVDAHTHMNTTREALIDDLQRRAYFGVGAAVSMGSDGPDTPLELRDEMIPDAARFRSAGHGITGLEPGRRVVHWVTTEADARLRALAQQVRHAIEQVIGIVHRTGLQSDAHDRWSREQLATRHAHRYRVFHPRQFILNPLCCPADVLGNHRRLKRRRAFVGKHYPARATRLGKRRLDLFQDERLLVRGAFDQILIVKQRRAVWVRRIGVPYAHQRTKCHQGGAPRPYPSDHPSVVAHHAANILVRQRRDGARLPPRLLVRRSR